MLKSILRRTVACHATTKSFNSNMAFSCPPERLLRQARRSTTFYCATRNVSNGSGHVYRAALVTELGKPLQVQQMPKSDVLPEGFVRVAIHHAAINFADILMSQGKYQEKPPLPFCPGSELSGVISEIGPNETRFKVGDRVFGVNPMGGAYASESLIPANSLFPVPDGMTTDVASAILIVYGTAMMALQRRASIKPGDTVLVTSAAGGVGLAAVDLAANYFQANVIGACSTDEKCAIASSRGAKHTINYSRESLGAKVKELTDGKGADIIVDNVGGQMMKECLKSVAFEGRILVIGFTSGEIPKIPANLLLVKSCSAVGVYWGSYSKRNPKAFKESVRNVLEAYTQGKIQPHVSRVFTLSEVNDAFQNILSRASTGKVVLDCQKS